eukprot:ANDGO_03593.mRNA.1 putative splicing factor 3A subunit 1
MNAPNVILPPREIRVLVDKTSAIVAQKGAKFEAFLRQKEAANPRFQFLAEDSPYHSFYKLRIEEFREGSAEAFSKEKEEEEEEEEEKKKRNKNKKEQAAVDATLVSKTAQKRADLQDDRFSVALPPSTTFRDLESLKAIAQYLAIRNVAQSEWASAVKEPCCHERHPLFKTLRSFVSAYLELLKDVLSGATAFMTGSFDRFKLLDQIKYRSEVVQEQRQQKLVQDAKRTQALATDGTAPAQVLEEEEAFDWYDFVVVETIPLTVFSKGSGSTAGEQVVGEFEGRKIVRKDPSALGLTAELLEPMAIDPVTGAVMPISKISEHLRVQLMSSEWKQLKDKEAMRYSTTNLVSNEDAVSQIMRFGKQREDGGDARHPPPPVHSHTQSHSVVQSQLPQHASSLTMGRGSGQNIPPPISTSSFKAGEPDAKRMRYGPATQSSAFATSSSMTPANIMSASNPSLPPPPPPPPPPLPPTGPPPGIAVATSIPPKPVFQPTFPPPLPPSGAGSSTVSVRFLCPSVPEVYSWKFNGQVAGVNVSAAALQGASEPASLLKESLIASLGSDCPSSKIRLSTAIGGVFLKDSDSWNTLSQHIVPHAAIHFNVSMKERGGRKK